MNRVILSPEYFPNPTIGRPISNADIYVGIVDLDPEIVGNQKQISVQQENGTIVAVTQPISTGAGGVPLYLGSPVTILVSGDYSLKVLDKLGAQVYYVPKQEGFIDSTTVDDMLALINITGQNDGDTASILGFFVSFPQSTFIGGGGFVWQEDLNKNTANGGSVIDQDNTGGFDGTVSTRDAFLTAQGGGVGTGCWVREDEGKGDVTWFGAVKSQTIDSSASFQSASDDFESVYAPSGDYLISTAISADMDSSFAGDGPSRTQVFLDSALVTGNVGFVFTFDDENREGASVSDMSIIRKTNTGGDAVVVNDQFIRNSTFRLENVVFKGDSLSAVSPFYFTNCFNVDDCKTISVKQIRVYGNIDPTLDPAGQVQTTAFRSSGDAGQHVYDDIHILTMYNGFVLEDGVEGFYISNTNIVSGVNGIVADATIGDPGGWLSGVHINVIQTCISMTNRSAVYGNGLVLFRSDNYFADTWIAMKLDKVARGSFSDIVIQCQDGAASMQGIRLTDSEMLTFTGMYLRGDGNGLTSGGSNQSILYDNVIFHDMSAGISMDATDTGIVLGEHSFLAMARIYGTFPFDSKSRIRDINSIFGSSDASETTFSAAGTTALIIEQQKNLVRYFFDTGAGVYTHNIDLRDDNGVRNGDGLEFVVRFAASANPTISFRDGSGGPVLITLTNTSGTAKTVNFKFAFDGAAWFVVSSSIQLTSL